MKEGNPTSGLDDGHSVSFSTGAHQAMEIRDARATVEELRQSHDDASGKTAKMDLQKEIEKVSARTTRARVVCDRPRAWKNARGTR